MEPKYLVVEIQSNHDGTVGNIVTSYDDLNSAYSKFYTILAAAAISNVAKHTAVIMDDGGYVHGKNSFVHPQNTD